MEMYHTIPLVLRSNAWTLIISSQFKMVMTNDHDNSKKKLNFKLKQLLNCQPLQRPP